MAIRRASKRYNSDYMSRYCDERLEQLEDRLTALYANASNDVQAEFTDWISYYQEEDKRKRRQLEAGEITGEQYSIWRRNSMLRTNRYQNTIESLTDMLVNTDVAAMALVADELPYIIAQSYNFVQSLGFAAADEAGLTVGTFQIYNARSVQILLRDNPQLLPVVDIPEDRRWNRDRINREITQSIVRGDSIPRVAERLQSVTNMDENAAIRNARTAMTGAENMGRDQSAEHLRSSGVPVRSEWSATHDDRTRDSHLLLDGTFQDEDGLFGVGIIRTPLRYPGDPLGDPEEIYNCRCRELIRLEGIDHSQDAKLYEQFMQNNYPDDWAQLQAYEAETGKAAERERALERQAELRRNR